LGAAATSAVSTTNTTRTAAVAKPPTFSAQVNGTLRQGRLANGLVELRLSLAVAGQQLSSLDVRIDGQPLGAGVQMTGSAVTLGTSSNPTLYRGTVTALNGSTIEARVRSGGTRSLVLVTQLQIDPRAGSAAGTLNARPA
jgi:hypothetical protein